MQVFADGNGPFGIGPLRIGRLYEPGDGGQYGRIGGPIARQLPRDEPGDGRQQRDRRGRGGPQPAAADRRRLPPGTGPWGDLDKRRLFRRRFPSSLRPSPFSQQSSP